MGNQLNIPSWLSPSSGCPRAGNKSSLVSTQQSRLSPRSAEHRATGPPQPAQSWRCYQAQLRPFLITSKVDTWTNGPHTPTNKYFFNQIHIFLFVIKINPVGSILISLCINTKHNNKEHLSRLFMDVLWPWQGVGGVKWPIKGHKTITNTPLIRLIALFMHTNTNISLVNILASENKIFGQLWAFCPPQPEARDN